MGQKTNSFGSHINPEMGQKTNSFGRHINPQMGQKNNSFGRHINPEIGQKTNYFWSLLQVEKKLSSAWRLLATSIRLKLYPNKYI